MEEYIINPPSNLINHVFGKWGYCLRRTHLLLQILAKNTSSEAFFWSLPGAKNNKKLTKPSFQVEPNLAFVLDNKSGLPMEKAEACVAQRLTPQTLDLEVGGSSLALLIVSLYKEL